MDPEDLLEEPYNFGECWSIETTAPAYCNAWKNRSREIKVLIRKEGEHTHVHFPSALFSSREGINTDQCKIIVDLYYPLADKDSMFYISKCRSRNFMGSMQIYNHIRGVEQVINAEIDYDRNWGTLTFVPVLNRTTAGDKTNYSTDVYDIGILDTTITIDEEPEDLVVSADEDDTMGERDPVISVFPDDINNEEYDEDGIPEGWIKQTYVINIANGALDPVSKNYPVIHAKNKEGTKGILVIPPVMRLIKRATGSNNNCLFNVAVNNSFFGNFPAGIIADDGEVTVYTPHRCPSSGHYQKTGAIIYFNNSLRIAPKGVCDYFNFLTTNYVKQREIGLTKIWKIEFDIPSTTPTYTNPRPQESKTVEIEAYPYFNGTLTRTLPLKAHTDVWDEYVFGEAECEYKIIESETARSYLATITMKNLLSPLKKTTSLKKDTLHISIDDLLDFYAGNFEKIKSCTGKVKAYNPTSKAVEEMDVSATLNGIIINVVPNGVNVNQFYTEDINITEDVGIVEMTIIINVLPEFF